MAFEDAAPENRRPEPHAFAGGRRLSRGEHLAAIDFESRRTGGRRVPLAPPVPLPPENPNVLSHGSRQYKGTSDPLMYLWKLKIAI